VFRYSRNQEPVTFMWLTGNIRNVGDSALRRVYLNAVLGAGSVRAWVGDPTSGYARGLQLPVGGPTGSLSRWIVEFAMSTLRRRTHFAFNAGEFVVTREYFVGLVFLLPWVMLCKLRNGKVIWMGAAVADTKPFFMWPFRLLARMADDLRWRDSHSQLGHEQPARMPDWAFGVDAPHPAMNRTAMTISLRGDRPFPADEWLSSVMDACSHLGLSPVVVVQVEDDQVMAELLATRLGAELVGWAASDHYEQEQVVRGAYQRSAVTLSDRLHVLIIAATEGSVPLAWVDRAAEKVRRHFNWLGATWVSKDVCNASPALRGLTSKDVECLRLVSSEIVDSAYIQVVRAAADLTSLLK